LFFEEEEENFFPRTFLFKIFRVSAKKAKREKKNGKTEEKKNARERVSESKDSSSSSSRPRRFPVCSRIVRPRLLSLSLRVCPSFVRERCARALLRAKEEEEEEKYAREKK